MATSKFARRSSALKNVAVKRSSINAVVNLNALVRVFFLDGSSKVLQMFENSTAQDILIALKFNLDLKDISTHALFRVCGSNIRRVELQEVITETLRDPTDSGQEVRLLFRSWVNYTYGIYDHEVCQYGIRNKQPNTALWLAFMEATFMVMTEKYYLTEDESITLGCLKMQAESGDFNPSVHTLDIIKQRVLNRFPLPVRNKMKALSSNTLSGSHLAQDLATRIQLLYARMSGKSKVEAQINYLEYLRTYSPFYGSHYYDIQCQYDENPNDTSHSPPVITMQVSIGPNGLHLITPTDPPVIMRHSYKRILKWISHPDKHIFTYYVMKRHVTFADLEELQEEYSNHHPNHPRNSTSSSSSSPSPEINIQNFCDCVYLVSNQVKEIEYLVKSYVKMLSDEAPQLPHATHPDLLPPKNSFLQLYASVGSSGGKEEAGGAGEEASQGGASEADSDEEPSASATSATSSSATPSSSKTKKKSRLSIFFHSIGNTNEEEEEDEDKTEGINHFLTHNSAQMGGGENYGDDTAAVGNSLFKNMYSGFQKNKKSSSSAAAAAAANGADKKGRSADQAIAAAIPPSVQYAASMSELKRLAEETGFSDNDSEGEGEEEEEDEDEEGGEGEGRGGRKAKGESEGERSGEDEDSEEENWKDQIAQKKMTGIPSVQAFKRASRILFGLGNSSGTNQKRTPPPPPKHSNHHDDSGDDGSDDHGDGSEDEDD